MNKSTSFRTLLVAACLAPFAAHSQGNLENPVAGSVESGIGLVSGWHCSAKEIRVHVDGVDIGKSGVGSLRDDTVPVCGQNTTGFSLLFNYNLLTPGTHTISVYADGAHLETRQFDTVRSGGVPFLEGATDTAVISGFPKAGTRTRLQWSQAKQSFVVVGSEAEDLMGEP